MKEYLNPLKDGGYELSSDCLCDDSIEVPKGAFILVSWRDPDQIAFYKENFTSVFDRDKWCKTPEVNLDHIDHTEGVILWQRQRINETEYLLQDKNGEKLLDSIEQLKEDNVNHPSHYCGHPSGIECIEITRHHDFAIGNAIKYLWRAGLKDSDNEVQDLKKAVWYIQDKIKQLESKVVDDKTIDWIDEGNK